MEVGILASQMMQAQNHTLEVGYLVGVVAELHPSFVGVGLVAYSSSQELVLDN